MLFNTAQTPLLQLLFSNEWMEVWKDDNTGHSSLFALKSFQPGDVVCDFGSSAILHTPSYLTVQIGLTEHICLSPVFLQYINHGCAPNVLFNTSTYKLECLREIKVGEELTYFYPATEWDMAQPFQCLCGSENCLGYISGASHLSKDVLAKYKLTNFIYEQLKAQESK